MVLVLHMLSSYRCTHEFVPFRTRPKAKEPPPPPPPAWPKAASGAADNLAEGHQRRHHHHHHHQSGQRPRTTTTFGRWPIAGASRTRTHNRRHDVC